MIMATVAFIVVGIFMVGLSAVEAESPCCSIRSIELPCWEVHSIDTTASVVTAVAIGGATVIQFKVADRVMLSRLKVHDPVVPDFNTWRVAVLSANVLADESKLKPGDPRGPAAALRCGDEDFVFCCAITVFGIER